MGYRHGGAPNFTERGGAVVGVLRKPGSTHLLLRHERHRAEVGGKVCAGLSSLQIRQRLALFNSSMFMSYSIPRYNL